MPPTIPCFIFPTQARRADVILCPLRPLNASSSRGDHGDLKDWPPCSSFRVLARECPLPSPTESILHDVELERTHKFPTDSVWSRRSQLRHHPRARFCIFPMSLRNFVSRRIPEGNTCCIFRTSIPYLCYPPERHLHLHRNIRIIVAATRPTNCNVLHYVVNELYSYIHKIRMYPCFSRDRILWLHAYVTSE